MVPELIDALNGPDGPPAAVTVGGAEIYFVEPDAALERHEGMHVTQAARFAPWWARLLPRRVRAWLGFPRFLSAYAVEHGRHGYVFNKFEVEARAAERLEEDTPRPPEV